MQRLQVGRGGHGVQDELHSDRLVPDEQVVVDLHHDQAAGRETARRFLRGRCRDRARRPCRQPGGVGDLGDRGPGNGDSPKHVQPFPT